MSDRQIRELLTLPDGKILRGYEVDFDSIKEDWAIYKTSENDTLRVKNVVVKVFRLVDESEQASVGETGDPEYYIVSQVTLAARQGTSGKESDNATK